MSRLYLIFLFLFGSGTLFSQNELGKYLKFADEQYEKGDYFYALTYYEKALQIDSQTVSILWRYAETLKAYKDYRKAEEVYLRVYSKEEALLYPSSLLNVGLMQKHNGKYDEAVETFKRCKKKYFKDKKSYLYLKSNREIESCLWAKSALKDTLKMDFFRLPETINSPDSEFGHSVHEGKFIFSSLRADSIPSDEEVYATHYKTHLFSSELSDHQFNESTPLQDLFFEKWSSGNGSFSIDGKRFYFSLCEEEGFNYRCRIMVANYSDGKWSKIDTLGPIINEVGANTTMPCIGEMDGQETLFFASDRTGTEGGMDIYYSTLKNGNQYSKVKTIKSVNSVDNELSPWWDKDNKRLYFSSSWHNGFGGTDVHYSHYSTQFENPVNVGLPINSSANDLYYFRQGDTSYVSSNRMGVLYSKNPTCCSDIFSGIPPRIVIPPTPKETLADLNKRLPVTLYFHNDVPDPRSHDTTTKVNYLKSYTTYKAMLEQYKNEYSAGLKGDKAEEAKEDIESFFIEHVDQGVKDLALFRDLLFQELEKGSKIKITIKGFASPLAKTDYNVNLTKRRIGSLINYLNEYEEGKFSKYISHTAENGGELEFAEIPFGEYTANKLTSDNPNDQKNSVYSRRAGIERKIEIQSVNYKDVKENALHPEEKIITLATPNQLFHGGKIEPGAIIEHRFTVTNTSKEFIEFDLAHVPCECTTVEIEKKTLAPGETTTAKMTFHSKGYEGQVVKSVYLKVKKQEGELRLIISGEIIP
jgi:hypothetical protein